jgi:hypothetical protein
LLTEQFDRRMSWLALSALGGFVFIVGVVLLVVGIVRRSRAKRRTQPPWPPTPYASY